MLRLLLLGWMAFMAQNNYKFMNYLFTPLPSGKS
jgi:hypothetical protein